MLNFGFQGDFDLFRARGQIGAVLSIDVPSDTPEIGTVCPVTFRTSGVIAWASIDGQGRFGVSDGEVVRVRMREDRSLQIRLFGEAGAESDAVTLTPLVAEPELTALTLPVLTTYSQNRLSATVATRNTTEVRVSYQVEEEHGGWQGVPLDNDGRLTLPVLERPHTLVVRVELASRHAQLSPRARRVVEQKIVIRHPEPSCQALRNEPVFRFQEAQVPLAFRWVRSAQVIYDNSVNEAQQVRENQFQEPVHLVTNDIGTQHIQVEMEALDGTQHQFVIDIEVLPRRLAVDVTPIEFGNAVELTIEGGNQPRLSVPSRLVEIDLPATGGLISHGFLLPTQAHILVIDDLGKESSHQLLLEPPEHVWRVLPEFAQLTGWRI